jgi:hypothetical protein
MKAGRLFALGKIPQNGEENGQRGDALVAIDQLIDRVTAGASQADVPQKISLTAEFRRHRGPQIGQESADLAFAPRIAALEPRQDDPAISTKKFADSEALDVDMSRHKTQTPDLRVMRWKGA